MPKILNRDNTSNESDTTLRTKKSLADEMVTQDEMEMRLVVEAKSENKIRPVNIPTKLRGVIPTTDMRNMFVEMCFFARLGFVQPPCCLSCAYTEAKASSPGKQILRSKKKSCSNLIVWRYNADLIIHPDTIDKNMVCIKCETARAWLKGETVQGLKWDSKAKKLVSVKNN